MKVLVAHNRYYIRGGDDRIAWNSAGLLKAHGHRIIPFAMNNPHNRPSEYSGYFVPAIDYAISKPTLTNLTTAMKMIYSFEGKKKLAILIGKVKPDIAHIHNIYGRITPAILPVLKNKKIPCVMTLHDYKLICPSYSMLNGGKTCELCKGGRYYKALTTRCHKNSFLASLLYCFETYVHKLLRIYEGHVDYFIMPSRFMMNKMIEFGMPADKFVHIHNFVEVGSYIPRYRKSNYILYCGRLSHEKGIYTLLKAAVSMDSVRFVIAGDGGLRQELELFADTNGIRNVQFLGHLFGSTLANTLKNCNFVIVPSECYENCPMVILEAFAFGKPVIGARIGGIPELIDDGTDGLLFEPGDVDDLRNKIAFLLHNPAKVAEMGRQARKKVEREYNSDIYYQRLINVYDMAVSKVKSRKM